MGKFLMDKDGNLTRNPDYKENKTYSICCKMCGHYIGESETNDNGSAICLDCYNKM